MRGAATRRDGDSMDIVLEILGIFLLLGFSLLALASLVFGLPGTFLILGAAIVFGWATGFAEVGGGTLATLLAMALTAEGIELWAGTATAARAGVEPSRRVTVMIVVGAFIGGILGTPFLFGIGALFGGLGGAFLGAALAVRAEGGSTEHALVTGMAAFRGRLLGFIVKVALAVAMIGLIVVALF